MKDVYIHIGLHKTASTFLQEKVFPHFTNTTLLTRPYTQHNHAFNKLQYADDSLYDKEEMITELSKINGDRILISDESLSGKPLIFCYINRTIIANRLKDIFPDAKIILFIRGQRDILMSHYYQGVKGIHSGYLPIDKFFWHPQDNYTYEMYQKNGGMPSLDTLYYNTNIYCIHLDCFLYYELISLYKKLFKNVAVFLYEDLRSDPLNVIQQIESILEDKIVNKDKIDLINKVNIKMSREALRLRRFINRFNRFIDPQRLDVLIRSKLINRPFNLLFNIFRVDKDPFKEERYIEEICERIYADNNRNILSHYPDIGLNKYPESYSTR